MPRKKAEGENGQGRVNKMELVRQALATLGNDTSPVDIAKHLKEQAKVKISVGTATTYKSAILKKLGKSPRRRKRRRGKPAAGESAPVAAALSDAVSLKDIRMLHEISERLGRTRVRELLELLH